MLSNQHLLTVCFAMLHIYVSYYVELWGHAAGCRDVLLIQKKAVCVIYSAADTT